ncbi:MAG TPA: GAF domain-containing protein [Anaerolineales bacterium]|nr:GAF domain-containing protein [Anaerolineales bacterium]
MNIPSRSALVKWGIILLLALPHIFLTHSGNRYQGAISMLPVAAAGWFFGGFAGILAGIITVAHYFLTLRLGNVPLSTILDNNFIFGGLIVILIGGISAWLKDVYEKQLARDRELTKRLQEADALSRITTALSEAERVGLSNILQLIVDSAKEIIPGVKQAVIHLLDEENELLIPEAVTGFQDTNYKEINMHLGEGVAGQVISSGETINIANVTTDPRFLKSEAPPKFRSLMVAPVSSGRQKLGTISVQSHTTHAFNENDRNLLKALGTQAAIAIENAHLLESTQQALRETDALYRISQGLVSLNAEELLEDAVNLLQTNFGYYHVQLFIIDSQTGDFILQAGSGEIGRALKKQNYHLRAGSGIVGHTAETLKPFFTNDVDQVVFFIRNPLLRETKSEMTVPVRIGNQLLGILDIQQAPPKTFTTRDLQLVSAMADQLAVALQKADLYENLQKSLQQEQTVRSQLIQSERLALVGRLLASVSHELNNPLQAIQNALFLLKEEKNLSSQGGQDLDIILSETERMAALIERLRSAYRPLRVTDFQPVHLNNLIEDVYALISTHMRHKDIAFEFIPDPNLPPAAGISDQLRQVVLNLFLNAVEIMKPGGRLTVETHDLTGQNEVFFSVRDSGPGIDPELLPKIFDAFITSKHTGTGLGLTITHDILEQHHGRIQAANHPNGGAIFYIWLPVYQKEPV